MRYQFPSVRGFEFNVPASSGPYTRLILRDSLHAYEYTAEGAVGALLLAR